jgi:hypothetical protein
MVLNYPAARLLVKSFQSSAGFIKFDKHSVTNTMERRFWVTGIILAVCIIAITTVFFIRTKNHSNANPLKIIPQDAALIVKINSFNFPFSLDNKSSKVWNDLSSLPAMTDLNANIHFIDSIIKLNPKFYNPSAEDNIFISGHVSPSRGLLFLCIIPLPSAVRERDLNKLVEQFDGKEKLAFSKRKFEGKTILTLLNSGNRSLNFTYINGFLLYSASPVIIEDAIKQASQSKSLVDNSNFSRLLNSVGKSKEANIFLDLKQVGSFFCAIAGDSVNPEIRKYTSFGDWLELDLTQAEDFLMMNGFTQMSDSTTSFIRFITRGKPVDINASEVLPADVAGFFSFGISDPEESYKDYKTYLQQIGKLATYQANLENLNGKYHFDFSKFFLSVLSDEITLAYSGTDNSKKENYYLLIKTKSGTEAEKGIEKLVELIDSKAKNEVSFIYSPDKEFKQKIFKLPIYPLFGRLFGDFFNRFDENYITILNNYIVVCGTSEGITHLIDNFILQKTLKNDEVFKNYNSSNTSKSYFQCYINLAYSSRFFSQYLNNELIRDWQKNLPVFEKTQTFGFQISEVSEKPYFNIFLKHCEDFRGRPQTVWESLLDTALHFKPRFLINHNTKQNEIFIQDDKNTIYLINQAGRILWELPLNEHINSDVYQIDYYGNGKLQILFSTTNYIHLIDRNGNYTEHYPVRLHAKSTAGLALFDYDSDKNYRIVIPCDDKKVYVYSKDGTTIKGWNFKESDHTVTQPVNHFKVEDKDYLVFGDENYTYILDRKGDERIRLSSTFSKSALNTYYLSDVKSTEKSFYITTDTTGNVYRIYLNGKVEKQTIKKFSSNHFFDYKDVDADGTNDLIFLDKNTLSVYKTNGELIFEKAFDTKICQRPVYYQFSPSDRKIGLVSDENNTVYLLNSNGSIYKGFPLEGTTLFTIGHFDVTSNRFNLIVGGRNNFLYNYAVE